MGCLRSLIRKIIFFLIVGAFFALGGWNFVQNAIHSYQNPPREDFIEQERDWGDFSHVSSDYQLSRCFNLFGYKKIDVKYLPTNQKITILDLKDEDKITVSDFKTNEIDSKIDSLLKTFKDSFVTLEDFQITKRGQMRTLNKVIPYIEFSAKVKNIPFKNLRGFVAAYSSINQKAQKPSTKLIYSAVDKKAYNPKIISDFIGSMKL